MHVCTQCMNIVTGPRLADPCWTTPGWLPAESLPSVQETFLAMISSTTADSLWVEESCYHM